MFSKETIDAMAGTLGITVEELTKGLTSEEEVTLELPELKTFTPKDLETLLDNKGKERYDAGRVAEREIVYKELSKEVGIDTIKNHKEFVGAYKNVILEEAKVEPDKKIADLETSISNLQGIIAEKDTTYNTLAKQVQMSEQKFKVQSFIPTLPETIGITKEEATSLFFSSHEKKEDGVYKNGVLLKDNLENPITLEQAVKTYVTDRGWDKKPAGRGGGAGGGSGTSTPTTYEGFQEVLKEKGLTEGSAEANALLVEIAKEHPEVLD